MTMPGFAAQASLYEAGMRYWTGGSGATADANGSIVMAQDPCSRCAHLYGCAKARCYCICYGGDWSPGHFGSHFPCGICF